MAKLLAGGNPQIPKGNGDAPVQAYIQAAPEWKGEVSAKLDSLISKHIPGVKKAVKWNSPFYGIEGQGWIVNFHCMAKYVKVAFFAGGSLKPKPPEASKDPKVRYFHIHEDDDWDEDQFIDWIQQASKLEGWNA